MKGIDQKKIIRIIREEYMDRLLKLEVAARIAEAEAIDNRGNVLVAKDLKVRHIDSGFEYTVDRVEGEGDGMIIYLRKPEVPRIKPAVSTKTITEDEAGKPVKKSSTKNADEQAISEPEIFAISAAEYESEYIVD